MVSSGKFLVKQENADQSCLQIPARNSGPTGPPVFIDLSSSESDSDSADVTATAKRPRDSGGGLSKGRSEKKEKTADDLPVGFLDPLPAHVASADPLNANSPRPLNAAVTDAGNKQFWKAGDYEGAPPPAGHWNSCSDGMDHVRVHPKFLHSNATSHKWVLGAFAELLDNSLDEVCSGATYVNLDMVKSKKDGSKMLLIEDNGGGMNPDKMRQCMSLGYSAKSKMVDTIGQYGNGFKTSTMRLGADVIVFSRSLGKDGKSSTQSIGLLSYTFLRSTGKEDIVVPMLDYERRGRDWNKIVRSSLSDWKRNVETVVQWSPFPSEEDLLRQFNQMKDHGTRIIIYNLWEDDVGLLELDFDTDPHDIQIRGVNRDEKNIEMAKNYPNSRHFLTYRHSLRNYAAILYLRIPPGFRIILRGKDVDHHNIVNDMMMSNEITYRPQHGVDGIPNASNMVAVVTVGFVKDAKAHIDVQGFNVYHKNRLIKPFWRVWHPPGSDGRGVIGVLEANFVEPAHDKQGFERTTVLARLETRLIQMQKTYWTTHCHKIGYAPRRNQKALERDASPDSFTPSHVKKSGISSSNKSKNEHLNGNGLTSSKIRNIKEGYAEPASSSAKDDSDADMQIHIPRNRKNDLASRELIGRDGSCGSSGMRFQDHEQNMQENGNGCSPLKVSSHELVQLEEDNHQPPERLKRKESEILGDLMVDLQKEKERSQSLQTQLLEANRKCEELVKEQDSIIDIFQEERQRRDVEEEKLRKKLKEASNTIQELTGKIRQLERRPSAGK